MVREFCDFDVRTTLELEEASPIKEERLVQMAQTAVVAMTRKQYVGDNRRVNRGGLEENELAFGRMYLNGIYPPNKTGGVLAAIVRHMPSSKGISQRVLLLQLSISTIFLTGGGREPLSAFPVLFLLYRTNNRSCRRTVRTCKQELMLTRLGPSVFFFSSPPALCNSTCRGRSMSQ